jgi:RNA polymerase sigma-70 factor (ECF subfamily)
METTSPSLLERVRQPADQAAWSRFVQLYTPLLYAWTQRLGLQPADAGDLVQDVFARLLERLPAFQYDQQGSFRAWLKTMLLNQWRDRCRRQARAPQPAGDAGLSGVADPAADAAFLHEAEYRQRLVGRALQILQVDFQPETWQAFWETEVAGRPVSDVARDTGLSPNAVYLARSRVLRRLREELAGLLE